MADLRVTPQPWLWQPRRRAIRFVEIHAIRGNTTPALQLQSALNWVQSPNNGSQAQGWGSSFSKGIGREGEMGIVLDDNQAPTYSAGYGRLLPPGSWSIDEYGISLRTRPESRPRALHG